MYEWKYRSTLGEDRTIALYEEGNRIASFIVDRDETGKIIESIGTQAFVATYVIGLNDLVEKVTSVSGLREEDKKDLVSVIKNFKTLAEGDATKNRPEWFMLKQFLPK